MGTRVPSTGSFLGLTRRRFALAVPLFGAITPWSMAVGAQPTLVSSSRTLMGTRVDITVVMDRGRDAADVQEATTHAFAEMARLEALMSRYRSDSQVSAINRAAGRHAVPISPEVMAVLGAAQTIYRESDGAFDPSVGGLRGWHFEPGAYAAPTRAEVARDLHLVNMRALSLDTRRGTAYLAHPGMALDLGGVAKLPILDAGIQCLKRSGMTNALINGGGDVLAMGHSRGGQPWRIGLRDPAVPSVLQGVVNISGRGVVASSGDYERAFVRNGLRLHHVLDPRTGWPTSRVHGVALLARDISAVNGWGTALMVLGADRMSAWQARHPDAEVALTRSDGTRWMSPGMRAALQAANT